jgi:hypothetical protein
MCVRGIYPTHPSTKRASRNPSAVATISTLWSSGGAAVGALGSAQPNDFFDNCIISTVHYNPINSIG